MEIIETIPIYGIPDWVGILFVSSFILGMVATISAVNTKYICVIIAIISLIGLILSGISAIVFNKAEFKHNEYIVRITDMPVQDFIEKYEVVKYFDYSDVIQIKEIEKK